MIKEINWQFTEETLKQIDKWQQNEKEVREIILNALYCPNYNELISAKEPAEHNSVQK